MLCLVCGESLERGKSWDHIRAAHLQPLGLTQELILDYAREAAYPLEVRPGWVTCVNLKDQVIYFSLENAELLIGFAHEHGRVPWQDVVAWQVLHEKGHLVCHGLYEAPSGVPPFILMNVEDYWINRYLIPEKYWPVCRMNARCSVRIRNIAPLPPALRDGYYYCTLATFLAYGAVTVEDLPFLTSPEARLAGLISQFFLKITQAGDIVRISQDLARCLARHYRTWTSIKE